MAEASQKTPVKSEQKAADRTPAEWSPLSNLLDEFPWGWRRPLPRSVFDIEPFWRGFGGIGAVPAVDIAEKDKEYEITAELPGMDESNIDVKFADGVLTIKGEKKEEKEEKRKDYSLSERRYGSLQRSFPVPESVDAKRRGSSTAC
jgi:HSP20 family protein